MQLMQLRQQLMSAPCRVQHRSRRSHGQHPARKLRSARLQPRLRNRYRRQNTESITKTTRIVAGTATRLPIEADTATRSPIKADITTKLPMERITTGTSKWADYCIWVSRWLSTRAASPSSAAQSSLLRLWNNMPLGTRAPGRPSASFRHS